jgi:hypothetical protein
VPALNGPDGLTRHAPSLPRASPPGLPGINRLMSGRAQRRAPRGGKRDPSARRVARRNTDRCPGFGNSAKPYS